MQNLADKTVKKTNNIFASKFFIKQEQNTALYISCCGKLEVYGMSSMAISAVESDRHTYSMSSVAISAVDSNKPTYGMSSVAISAVVSNYRPTYGMHQWQYQQ